MKNKVLHKIFRAVSLVIAAAVVCGVSGVMSVNAEGAQKTLMIYMTGSDLSDFAAIDIQEMLASGANPDKLNIFLYTGGAREWPESTGISAEANTIYRYCGDYFEAVKFDKRRNMGSPNTLASFVKYGLENGGTDDNMLILWDHGGGPMLGYGLDEVYGDILTIDEIDSALQSAGIDGDNRLSLLGFDACLMGAVETANKLKDRAGYIVFSQETEPGFGWNYMFLKEVENTSDGAETARYIIDYYDDFYTELFKTRPDLYSDISLSCVDTDKLGEVTRCADVLFEKARDDAASEDCGEVIRARNATKIFGKTTTGSDYDLVDLKDLAERVGGKYSAECNDFVSAVESAVVYSKTSMDKACGMSAYFPYANRGGMTKNIEKYKGISFSDGYSNMINTVAERLTSTDTSAAWRSVAENGITPEKTETDGKVKYSYRLTDEQKKTFASAKYKILKKYDKDEKWKDSKDQEWFIIVYDEMPTVLDEDGTVSATMPKTEMYAYSYVYDEYSIYPLWLHFADDGSDREQYFVAAGFSSYEKGKKFGMLTDFAIANWYINVKDGKPCFGGAVLSDNDDSKLGMAKKQQIDYTQYDKVWFINFDFAPTYTENGKMNNFNKWKQGGAVGLEMRTSFDIELRNIPIENPDEYRCVFEIEDISGNKYTTELLSIAQ